jgi:hypothetical protein
MEIRRVNYCAEPFGLRVSQIHPSLFQDWSEYFEVRLIVGSRRFQKSPALFR